LGQYDKAINDFNKAIAMHPQYSFAYNNRGYSYEQLGQLSKAVEDFSQAIQLDPGNIVAQDNWLRLSIGE
jgi:Flp pilus assembly protein TadD